MRTNLPVTQREYAFPDNATLMSTTDLQSYITYANGAFITTSGFSKDELMGEPHNMVRHPDMPSEAFADMWATLKAGDSWSALVKNRRKDGDHYWVRANATPVRRGGQTVGYMSVRTRPSRSEIDAAESLYQRFREGKAQGLAFRKGIVVRTGATAWMSMFKVMPVGARIRLAGLLMAGLPLAGALAAGLSGGQLALVCGLIGAGALLGVAMLEAQIGRPLVRILDQARQVAAGQPGESLQFDRVDEIGMLLRSVNQSGLNLRALVDDVAEQVAGVQVASAEIAAGTQDLSSRTEQAAASLEETASSMEQMAGTVSSNAESAGQANELAVSTSELAGKGGSVVGEVVAKMSEITEASKRIADIITVIDGIAFQTNILALNAAVEAARAGEQGRGFAVVASEVRSLARRSADAAKEIKELITASVQVVDAGSSQVKLAGETMGEIVESVRRVTTLIGEITNSVREQGSGIAQVNEAVGYLDQSTQQNAALVEQSSAAAESLREQAARLVEAIVVYGGNATLQSAAAREPARSSQAGEARAEGAGSPAPARPVRAAAGRGTTGTRPEAGAAARAPARPGSVRTSMRPPAAMPAAAQSRAHAHAGAGDDAWEEF